MKNKKILCVLPKYTFGDQNREVTAEYLLIFKTLSNIFEKKNIKFFDVYSKNKSIFKNNNLLIKKVKKFRPDLIFFSIPQYEIYIDTLKIIKNTSSCKIINWYSDDTWRFFQQSIFYSKYFDLNITTSRDALIEYKKLKRKACLSNWSCPDKWLGKSKNLKLSNNKIIFIGSSYMGRDKIIKKLREKKFNIDCYGYGWKNKSVIRASQLPHKIRNALITLNFSKSRGHLKQTKARVFEIIGIGGFCLTEISHELKFFFSKKKHIDTFSNFEELVMKINFYLKNVRLRNKKASMANKFFIKNYTSRKVILDILKKIKFDKKRKKIMKKNLNYFNLTNIPLVLKLYKIISLFILKFFFNKNRSLKIARRILFEIEFRLRGERTYSINGWCSNLFNYH